MQPAHPQQHGGDSGDVPLPDPAASSLRLHLPSLPPIPSAVPGPGPGFFLHSQHDQLRRAESPSVSPPVVMLPQPSSPQERAEDGAAAASHARVMSIAIPGSDSPATRSSNGNRVTAGGGGHMLQMSPPPRSPSAQAQGSMLDELHGRRARGRAPSLPSGGSISSLRSTSHSPSRSHSSSHRFFSHNETHSAAVFSPSSLPFTPGGSFLGPVPYNADTSRQSPTPISHLQSSPPIQSIGSSVTRREVSYPPWQPLQPLATPHNQQRKLSYNRRLRIMIVVSLLLIGVPLFVLWNKDIDQYDQFRIDRTLRNRPQGDPSNPSSSPIAPLDESHRRRLDRLHEFHQLELLQNQIEEGWSMAQRFERDKTWATQFEEPSASMFRSVDLFPAPHAPTNSMHDSSGQSMHLFLRYASDAPAPEYFNSDSEHFYPVKYQMCSFKNVCIHRDNPQNLYFHFSNLTTYLTHSHALAQCRGNKYEHWKSPHYDASKPEEQQSSKPHICSCFHAFFRPLMRQYLWEFPDADTEALANLPTPLDTFLALHIDSIPEEEQLPSTHSILNKVYADPMKFVESDSHYWAVNKWVDTHHIAHWAQKLLMFSSLMNHAPLFYAPAVDAFKKRDEARLRATAKLAPSAPVTPAPHSRLSEAQPLLPAFTGLVFQDSDAQSSSHEETILAISIQAALGMHSRAYALSILQKLYPEGKVPRGNLNATSRLAHATLRHALKASLPAFLDFNQWLNTPVPTSTAPALIWSEDLKDARFATSFKAGSGDSGIKSALASIRHGAAVGEAAATTGTAEASTSPNQGHRADPVPPPSQPQHPDPAGFTCFNRFTFTPHYGTLSLHEHDTQIWRAHMRKHFNLIQARQRYMEPSPATAVASIVGLEPLVSGPAAASAASAREVALPKFPPHYTQTLNHAVNAPNRCPPRRITLLYRSNRRLLNYAAVLDMLAAKYNLTWVDDRFDLMHTNVSTSSPMPDPGSARSSDSGEMEDETQQLESSRFHSGRMSQLQYNSIDSGSTSLDQYTLFASTGLLIASHSSQLINVLWSGGSESSFIEMSPEFYNSDFARYASSMGLANYHHFIGVDRMELVSSPAIMSGPEPEAAIIEPEVTVTENEAMDACTRALNAACPTGLGSCIEAHSTDSCLINPPNNNKNLDFRITNLRAFESLVEKVVEGIELVCGGAWMAGFKTEREQQRAEPETEEANVAPAMAAQAKAAQGKASARDKTKQNLQKKT